MYDSQQAQTEDMATGKQHVGPFCMLHVDISFVEAFKSEKSESVLSPQVFVEFYSSYTCWSNAARVTKR